MRRGRLVGGAVVAASMAAVLGWQVWPRDPGPVAPPLTARQVSVVDHHEVGSLTRLSGGSRSEAHRLWAYYRDRPAYHGVRPRLLGVSRVVVDGTDWDGVYWLVLSDHAWQPNLGSGGPAGWYGREAVFVPDGGRSLSGNTVTF